MTASDTAPEPAAAEDAPAPGHDHAHGHGGLGTHAHAHEHISDGRPTGTVATQDGTSIDLELTAHWIEVEHVHFAYPDGFEALRGIDLRFARGEKVALVGPNGAGKSTFMLHLNGINTPSHGTVRVAGMTVGPGTIKRIRAEVGLVFQDPDDQLFSPTVFEDVAFGPIHMGVDPTEIHDRVERALAAVGMSGFERRIPHRLSIGQRKRVSLATVLSMDPSVLVFDEPSAGLDPRGRRELIGLLGSLEQTLIVSTHDMRLVAEVFPRTIVMDAGTVVADGPTAAILADDLLLTSHGLERP